MVHDPVTDGRRRRGSVSDVRVSGLRLQVRWYVLIRKGHGILHLVLVYLLVVVVIVALASKVGRTFVLVCAAILVQVSNGKHVSWNTRNSHIDAAR